ncbi:hypothetical protein ACLOJK_022418 [Asimina triloba]
MEEVAKEYVKELTHRNRLLVANVNDFGRVKACRMHDMMREVAISLSHKEDFSLTCDAPDAGQHVKKAADIVWLGIDLYQRWLDVDLAALASEASDPMKGIA